MDERFSALERAVLSAVCALYPDERNALESQLATAGFQGRENTGGGFFTNFTVDTSSTQALGGERLRDGPRLVSIEGLAYGMGFILWLKEGYAECLEGYSYAEPTTAIDFQTVAFKLDS